MRDTSANAISNPILASQRVGQHFADLRQAKRLQYQRLLELQEQGAQVFRCPKFHVEEEGIELSSERIGVVGLVVDGNRDEGYVTRLTAKKNATWFIPDNLPFRETHVREVVLDLLRAGDGFDQAMPELLAFSITDTLGNASRGGSMDIAALMSVIDAINDQPSILNAVAAVVAPSQRTPDAVRGIVKTESSRTKLSAFDREFGLGSLLIRHPDDYEAECFDDNFEEVWEVASFADLYERVETAGLLKKLLESNPLSSADSPTLFQYLDYLLGDESRYGQCKLFLDRLERRVVETSPLRIRLRVINARENLYRHSGKFIEAIKVCEVREKIVQSNSDLLDYDEIVGSANCLASELIDAHRFDDAVETLATWHSQIDKDPRLCRAETRTFLLNTLARAKVMIPGNDDWKLLFKQSIDLQKRVDITYVPRSTNYLIGALLRHRELDEAKNEIDGLAKVDVDPVSQRYLDFLVTDLDRQQGKTYSTAATTKLQSSLCQSSHSSGLLLQSLARQDDRSVESKCDLLQQASKVFMHNVQADDLTNIKRFLASICSLRASVATFDEDETRRWSNELDDYVNRDSFGAIRSHYQKAIDQCKQNPGDESVETLFQLVPYF